MNLQKITLSDFRCFAGIHTLALKPGTTFIMGTTEAPGADSNSAGKSSALASICWTLYGQLATGAKKDEVINWWRKECHVELTFDEITVHRSKKRGQAEELKYYDNALQGWVTGDVDVVQARLIDRIGVGPKTFFNSFWIDRESKSVQFLFAAPAARLKILEELISESYWSDLRKWVSESKMKTLHARLQSLQREMAVLLAVLQEKRQQIQGLQQARLQAVNTVQAAQRTHEAHIEDLAAALRAQEVKTLNALAVEKGVLRNLSASTDLDRINNTIAQDRALIGAKTEAYSGMYRGEANASCPTCARKFTAKDYEGTVKAKTALWVEIKDLQGKILSEETKRGAAVAMQNQLLNARIVLQREKAALQTAEKVLEFAKQQAPTDGTGELQRIDTQLMTEEAAVQDRIRAYTALKKEWEAGSTLLAQYEVWEKGFGGKGIPNLLLDDWRQMVGQFTAEYVSYFCQDTMTIDFPLDKDGFVVQMTYRGQKADIRTFNGGHIWRANMAVLLAIRRAILYTSTSHLDFLILDDPFAALDKTGQAYVIELCGMLTQEIHTVLAAVPVDHPDIRPEQVVWVKQNAEGASTLG